MSPRTPRPKNSPHPQEPDALPVPRLTLESKHPHRTTFLVVHYRTGDDFLALVTGLLYDKGWRPAREAPVPPLDGIEERVFEYPGSGLFNGHTPAEAGTAQGGVRSVSLTLGVPLYRRRLSLEDML